MAKIKLKIRRKDNPGDIAYWEEFFVDSDRALTVADALLAVRENMALDEDETIKPVVWECGCMEGACGACTMKINGKVALACTTFLDALDSPVILEPLEKFEVVRDLVVDRSCQQGALSGISVWSGVEDIIRELSASLAPPVLSADEIFRHHPFCTCILCGACSEACPQVNDRSVFGGAFVFAFALSLNSHFVGKFGKAKRLSALSQKGGVADCMGAKVCEFVCPKSIPLSEAAAKLGWDSTLNTVFSFLGR